jgi:hypothetical protein
MGRYYVNLQNKRVGRDRTMLKIENSVFSIRDDADFLDAALEIFRHQYESNEVYKAWVNLMKTDLSRVRHLDEVPFLPVGFFRDREVICGEKGDALVFRSSTTTSHKPSTHLVKDRAIYERSFLGCFGKFYGPPEGYCILALLPGYLERPDSSLVYMCARLIEESRHPDSGFYLRNIPELLAVIDKLKNAGQRTLLIGVSYALLDLCEHHPELGASFTVMETGGMKGTRKEMLKPELHDALREGLGVETIHSEYGMTEMLSQAYSLGDMLYESPPWLKFLIRETDDPLRYLGDGKTGGVNVIDLANIHSCAFVATQDLGRLHNGKLELMGRYDNSDVRGCNLLVG